MTRLVLSVDHLEMAISEVAITSTKTVATITITSVKQEAVVELEVRAFG
jgi:hypothetical protein